MTGCFAGTATTGSADHTSSILAIAFVSGAGNLFLKMVMLRTPELTGGLSAKMGPRARTGPRAQTRLSVSLLSVYFYHLKDAFAGAPT